MLTEVRVGPKGYIHGWIFVGAPGVGEKVFHPHHGHGTVKSVGDSHATVAFGSGEHTFEHRPSSGPARFESTSLSGEDVHAHLGKPSLTPAQAEAIDRYQNFLYHQLSAYLRTGDPHAEDLNMGTHVVSEAELKRVSALMDQALQQAKPTTKPITVYRGVSGFLPTDPKPGAVFSDKTYMATSTDPGAISVFLWNQAGTEKEKPWRITAPAGSKAISIYNTGPPGNAAEGEVLFPRGTRLRVTGVGPDYIDAEVIPESKRSFSVADTKTPYGPKSQVAYADPGYQKDGKARYPINTAAHCKAAWSYINQASNASAYSADQLKAIKGRIKAAAKRFGIQISDTTSSGRQEQSMDVERRYTPGTVEVRMGGEQQRRIGGYAAKFGKLSRNLGGFVERVEPSFFNASRADGWPGVICRYNHDDNMLLGSVGGGTLRLEIDSEGLLYEVQPPTARADVTELIERGDVRYSSFAFRCLEDDWSTSDGQYPMRSLIEGQTVDVAPVNSPAYMDATAGLRSLANHVGAPLEDVEELAKVDELRKFFVVTTGPTAPRKRTFGPAARAALLGSKADPWA